MSQRAIRNVILGLFFMAGMCSLMYQVIWTRMMALVFGVTVYAVSAVLCSFMSGLALGSYLSGRLAHRSKRPLVAFGLLEIAIGFLGLLFPLALRAVEPLFLAIYHTFYDLSYPLFSFIRFLVIFPILLVPTALMGANLPLVSRWFVRNRESMGRDIAFLYAINTAGAVAGAFLIGFILLYWAGMLGSLGITGLLNFILGGVSIAIGWRESAMDFRDEQDKAEGGHPDSPAGSKKHTVKPALQKKRRQPTVPAGAPSTTTLSSRAINSIILATAAAGFASMACEVLWTRALAAFIKNSTYAYSAILITLLAGLALGSFLYGIIAGRIRSPVFWLALVEIALGFWIIGSLGVIGWLPGLTDWIRVKGFVDSWLEIVLFILFQTAAVIFIPAILMGAALPLATRAVIHDHKGMARRMGEVYAANTVGTVLGAFVAGFVLIPLLGVRGSFLLSAAVNVLAGVALLFNTPGLDKVIRFSAASIAGLVLLLSFAVVPRDVISGGFARSLGRILFYDEDVTDTIMVNDPLKPDGTPDSSMRDVTFGDGRANGGHRTRVEDHFYGHLPMLLHPNPETVLSIGVCSGNTVGAISIHNRMKRFDCVELSAGVVEASKFIETNYSVFARGDDRIRLHIEDGRNYLLGTRERYDVINVNPPYVHTAGVIFLYTKEFLELCRDRLKPGGLMTHFLEPDKLLDADLRKLVATWTAVFPHVAIWNGPHYYSWNLVGSMEPIRVNLRQARERLKEDPGLAAKMAEDGLGDPVELFSSLLMNEDRVREYASGAKSIITDNRTQIDFSSPKSQFSGFGYFYLQRGLQTRNLSQQEYSHWVNGGWATLSKMLDPPDNVSAIVDWAGVPPEQRAKDERQIREAIDHRTAEYQKNYSVTIAITE